MFLPLLPHRWALATALALLLLAWAGPARAQWVAADVQPQGVSLTLTWPQPAHAEVLEREGELVLGFDQPLAHDALTAVAPRLAKWAPGLYQGYDTLVLTLAPGVRAAVEQERGRVLVHLRQTEAPPAEVPPDDGNGRFRLTMLKANLLWATGDVWAASVLLEGLGRQRPADVEILAARSAVEARQNRWRRAAALLDEALRLQGQPDRGGQPVRGSEHAPRVEVQGQLDDQQGLTRQALRASGHAFLQPGLRLHLLAEHHLLHPFATTPAPTPSPPLAGHATLRHDFDSGSWLAARGTYAAGTPGVAAEAEAWDRYGTTRLALAWQEPRWELPSLLQLATTRDSVSLRRTLRSWSGPGRWLRGDVSARVEARAERWSSHQPQGTWRTAAGDAALVYTSWRSRPRLSVTYGWQVLHTFPQGPGRSPLAALLPDSHVHAGTVALHQPLAGWLGLDVQGGYALNLRGRDAWQAAGTLAWLPPSGLQAFVRYHRGLPATGAGQPVSTATVHLGLVF